jgi:hypothetical protein
VLTIFRTNQVFYSVLLIFYIVALRFSVFLAQGVFKWTPSGQGLLSELIYDWVGSQQFISHVIALVLLLIQGFLVNLISINHRLANEVTLFPGLFYVLICCSIPDFLYLSPVLMGNTFFLIALNEMFDTYKNPACADRIFNAGFWTAIASFFYFPFAFFMLVLFASLSILRALNFQEVLMIATGMFLPYFLGGVYYFWIDRFDYFWEMQITRNAGFLDFGNHLNSWDIYIKIFLFAALIVFVLINNNAYFIKKNIQVQKKISILYWVLVISGFAVPFQNNITLEHFLMLAPSLGILISFTFSSMKNQWAESIHFLMLVVVLALQFVPWQL